MSWSETCAMKERVLFIAAVEAGDRSMAETCRLAGISRKTGYKLVERARTDPEGFMLDRSRAPGHCPHAVRPDVRERVLALRRRRACWGPKKLAAWFALNEPDFACPAPSTIGETLKHGGLVRPRRRRRSGPPRQSALTWPDAPNDVWSIDFKGWFRTGDGRRVDPLTLEDAASRYLLRLQGLERQETEAVWAVLDAAFREYGLPGVLRSDNGAPFASAGAGGLSRLAVRLIKAGVLPERIDPGCPQQNGRHERMHLTLKQETASPPARSWRAQAQRFTRFRAMYNEERPHEALGQVPPAAVYQASARRYDGRLVTPDYETRWQTRYVKPNGEICWQADRLFISQALSGERVGLVETGEDIWEVWYGPLRLGAIVQGRFERPRRNRKPPRNKPENVLPMSPV